MLVSTGVRDVLGPFAVAVLAALATGTMAASAAQAAPPEYGQCRELNANSTPRIGKGRFADGNCQELYKNAKGKVEARGNFEWYPGPPANCILQKKGRYKDSACSILDEHDEMGKGHYERQPCYPNCARYTGTTQGGFYLEKEVGLGTTVICREGAGSDEITGPTTGIMTYAARDCEDGSDGKACKGINQANGEIDTTPLGYKLLKVFDPDEVEAEVANVDNIDVQVACQGAGYYEVVGPLRGVADNESPPESGQAYIDQMDPETDVMAFDGTYDTKTELRYYETTAEFDSKSITATYADAWVTLGGAFTGAPVEINGAF